MSIRYAVREHVATVTIDRPRVKNAVGPEEWKGLAEAVERAAAAPAVRVLVFTGAGDAFCAGGDLQTLPERLALPRDVREANLLVDAQLVRRMRSLEKPIVARIDGPAVGAGLSLALACDLRVGSSRARLGAPFHRIGLTGDFGLLWLLPRAIGPAKAMELLMLGSTVDAAAALALGLLNRVVAPEHLDEETAAIADQLAAGPPIAQGFTKRGLYESLERDLQAMLAWEAAAQALCSHTADAHEGVQAFLERRPPRFTGR